MAVRKPTVYGKFLLKPKPVGKCERILARLKGAGQGANMRLLKPLGSSHQSACSFAHTSYTRPSGGSKQSERRNREGHGSYYVDSAH